MLKRLARWIVRDELEQAHIERAEAVNSAIDWRRRADDLRHEAHARGVALQHALACVPDAENVRARLRADSMLPADLRADAIGYVDWWCPGGILDTSVKNGGGDADSSRQGGRL